MQRRTAIVSYQHKPVRHGGARAITGDRPGQASELSAVQKIEAQGRYLPPAHAILICEKGVSARETVHGSRYDTPWGTAMRPNRAGVGNTQPLTRHPDFRKSEQRSAGNEVCGVRTTGMETPEMVRPGNTKRVCIWLARTCLSLETRQVRVTFL